MRVLAIAWAIAAGFLAVQAILVLNQINDERIGNCVEVAKR